MWSRLEVLELRRSSSRFTALAGAATLWIGLISTACSRPPEGHPEQAQSLAETASQTVETEALEVPPPPFSAGIYPCSNCHGMLPVDTTRRELNGFHSDIVLRHDEDNRWCLDCHDAQNRDVLHLANGAPVPFEESYRLCGQCHGEKYRDWRAGVHGRRTGNWNGHKTYLLCAHCHDPHDPGFQPMTPEPPPVEPSETVGGEGP